MKAFATLPVSILSLFVPLLLAPWAIATTYFNIQEPQPGRQWQNGAANPVQWTKGLLDDIPNFDIEIGRLSVDGILLVATGVPASYTAVNIYFDSVPTGDDYYMTFMNHTHGVTHAISPKFSIVNSLPANAATPPTPVANAPTVTVSGPPNPTATFATAFPDTGSAAALFGIRGGAYTALTVACGVVTGALLVFV
jgi:hypothetical protein